MRDTLCDTLCDMSVMLSWTSALLVSQVPMYPLGKYTTLATFPSWQKLILHARKTKLQFKF